MKDNTIMIAVIATSDAMEDINLIVVLNLRSQIFIKEAINNGAA